MVGGRGGDGDGGEGDVPSHQILNPHISGSEFADRMMKLVTKHGAAAAAQYFESL